MFETIFNESTEKFNDVDIFVYDSNHFSILGYQFTKSCSLKDKKQFFNCRLNEKHVNITIRKINGKTFMKFRDLKSHMNFENVKHIKVEELSNFFNVIIYI
jgi:hypothetical protein